MAHVLMYRGRLLGSVNSHLLTSKSVYLVLPGRNNFGGLMKLLMSAPNGTRLHGLDA